jgi:BirA family biotin operon repressor/biotin-[acetyl-CoA-carboxylase] ligase
MYEERETPVLPGSYELRMLTEVDSILEATAKLAADGADEGTLVWARSQTNARTRRGHHWEAPEGNLHCGLVLQPDYDNITAQQLCTVATVAAGAAVAERVAPMTGLGYRWPGDLLVNELLAGCVQIQAANDGSDPWPWLVLGLSVNVAHHPENPEPECYNSIHASGEAEHVRSLEILEQFTRHFLRWINIWAEEGYGPVRDAWMQRARDVGETRELEFPSRTVAGTVRGIGEHGELMLEAGTETLDTVSIAEYFGLQ